MSDLSFLDFRADFSSPRILEAYDELPLWSAMFGLLLFDELPLKGMKSVLDVGCGTGFPLIELAERLGPDAHVHGIDTWAGGLQRAAGKIACRNSRNLTLHEGNAAAMPFPDETFDLIVSNLGVNNFEDREAAIRECRRVLRQGATIALTTNLRGHMREFYEIFEDVLEASDPGALPRLKEHVNGRATIPAIRELLEGSGFKVVRVVERAGVMRFASGTALLNHHFIKLGFLEGWKGIVPDHQPAVFAALRDALDQRSLRDGELRLSIPMAYVEAAAH